MFYGLETISYCAPQLWTLLPEEFKQKNTISLFKSDVIDNGYIMSVPADCAKYFFLTLSLLEI